ncbi:hypothetical protein ISN44_As13g023770 [Arabidopsis suecica]|uniref:Uncharacterized protein n=1 Tax=Arabidopsis suecica TaxID=45249 RepID=A0A8T1Y2Z1_ARASU|nr:hypothetical protein ISN44_As13g023770 [Arabidopsis suecica]
MMMGRKPVGGRRSLRCCSHLSSFTWILGSLLFGANVMEYQSKRDCHACAFWNWSVVQDYELNWACKYLFNKTTNQVAECSIIRILVLPAFILKVFFNLNLFPVPMSFAKLFTHIMIHELPKRYTVASFAKLQANVKIDLNLGSERWSKAKR